MSILIILRYSSLEKEYNYNDIAGRKTIVNNNDVFIQP